VEEYRLRSDLWVLVNSDKVPVIEKPLMLLRKLGPKTANNQAQNSSGFHYYSLWAAPVLCKVQQYFPQRNHPHQFPLKVDTLLGHH